MIEQAQEMVALCISALIVSPIFSCFIRETYFWLMEAAMFWKDYNKVESWPTHHMILL
jgi:hypothetical protein